MPQSLEQIKGGNQQDKLFLQPIAYKTLRLSGWNDGDRVLIFNDLHVPFHDVALLKAVLRFQADFKPHGIIIAGDWNDIYELSTFDKNPSRRFSLQDELDIGHGLLKEVRDISPNARMVFIEGNHEDRLRRWLWKNSGAASLRSNTVESQLGFAELKIDSVCYGSMVNLCGFLVEHGYRAAKSGAFPANVARLMAVERGISGLCGHDHRSQVYRWADQRGSHTYINNGCLCLRTLEYVANPNWQSGFCAGRIFDGRFFPEPIMVQGKGFIGDGKLYRL